MVRCSVLLLAVALLLSSCDKGLEPPVGRPSISGRVTFQGQWPPDSLVKLLAVVLISTPPPYKPSDLISGLGSTVQYISIAGRGIPDTTFHFSLDTGTYYYLGVAQNYGDLFKDWQAIGFAHDEKDSSLVFHVEPGRQIRDVSIVARFDSLPRQPFVL